MRIAQGIPGVWTWVRASGMAVLFELLERHLAPNAEPGDEVEPVFACLKVDGHHFTLFA
jgi:hypothetical protein